MKATILAAIICAFAFSASSTFASNLQQATVLPQGQVIYGVSLLMETPSTPVGDKLDIPKTFT